jgi:GDP-mannose 6-dehydrogenase
VGSSRQYIEQVIPHIGALLCATLEDVFDAAEVMVVGTRDVSRATLQHNAKPGQMVIDFVSLEKSRRSVVGNHEGICW